jgi:hypothetical protein
MIRVMIKYDKKLNQEENVIKNVYLSFMFSTVRYFTIMIYV